MNEKRIRAQYRRWKLFYAELLATDDIELAVERAKARHHLSVFKSCIETAGLSVEVTP